MNTIRDKGQDWTGWNRIQNMGHGFSSVIHAFLLVKLKRSRNKCMHLFAFIRLQSGFAMAKATTEAAGKKEQIETLDWICAKCIYVIQPNCLFYTKITFYVCMCNVCCVSM